MFTITHRVIATAFALTSFAAAIVVGVWADNPLITILWRAITTLVICYAVGHVVGALAERAIRDQIEAYRKQHPFPDEASATPDARTDDLARDRAGKRINPT